VLAVQFSNTVCELGWTPVPDSVIVAGDPFALLVTVTDPLALPVVVGLKPIEIVRVCPDVSVTGVLAPLIEKPAPLAVI
jgi:hypothetical protein